MSPPRKLLSSIFVTCTRPERGEPWPKVSARPSLRAPHCSCHPQPLAGAQVARRAPPSLASGDVVRGSALRCEGGPRGPRPRLSPGGASRLSARSARVAARSGCAGGATVGGRGASAGGLACSVRGVARLGGGVDARLAAAATRALGSGDARDGSSYDDKLAAARAARAVKPTPGGRRGRAGGWQRVA